MAQFLSTPSARRATTDTAFIEVDYLFLSTPSARRATFKDYNLQDVVTISIHAIREEGDPLRAELSRCGLAFLSTPSARRAS